MQITNAELSGISPYEGNPRTISEVAIQKVANSIDCYGWQQPIVVDKDMVIIVGHTRYLAAKQLDLKTVPILIADKLSPEQVRAYRIADNRTNEENSWDQSLLIKELEQINSVDVEMLTGFNADELNEYLSGFDMSGMEQGTPCEQTDLGATDNDFSYKEQFGVIVSCANESEQQRVFEKLTASGHTCRVVVV